MLRNQSSTAAATSVSVTRDDTRPERKTALAAGIFSGPVVTAMTVGMAGSVTSPMPMRRSSSPSAAGVDMSSVIQYFGTKQGLFREAVHWDIPIAEMTSNDATETTKNLVRGMLAAWAADPNSPMAVLVRTSMASEDAAELLRVSIPSTGKSCGASCVR
jgi:hypothetical protein